ncbi:hypothetical protein Lepto7375DRAFT_5514 [Leptolyngbya sp. PCC 7375]|nr:hypothetical protein Lepto7375DRAFT_5514 [Leptolyngbya sp. PCC 7375]
MKSKRFSPILTIPVDRTKRDQQMNHNNSSVSIQASLGWCRNDDDCGAGASCRYGTCVGDYL